MIWWDIFTFQLCINTIGSHKCDCRDGYVLHMDNQTCIDKNMPAFRNGDTEIIQTADSTGSLTDTEIKSTLIYVSIN